MLACRKVQFATKLFFKVPACMQARALIAQRLVSQLTSQLLVRPLLFFELMECIAQLPGTAQFRLCIGPGAAQTLLAG